MQNVKNRCPVCGEGTLRTIAGEFRTHFEDALGTRTDLIVPEVTYEKCDRCGEELLDHAASTKISNAQRSAMGILSAEEILEIRRSLNRTQSQMSELLGIGEKTYCRWESGAYFQSEAFDRYLRLLKATSGAVKTLERIQLEKREKIGTVKNEGDFAYIRDVRVYESASYQFGKLLLSGPFHRA